MNHGAETVPIEAIVMTDRLREDDGDIAGLADSIQRWGLLHPLTVDAENRLIAGGRRLKAMQRLGFLEVEVRRWDRLSDAERRELELEENLRRKDLTAYEQAKTRLELAETVEQVIREESTNANDLQKSRMGRPPKGDIPERAVAKRMGVSRETIRNDKKVVAVAEAYPFLQRSEWNQSKALEVERSLNAIPEADRPAVAKLVDEPGIPPDRAISMIRNVASKPAPERREILDLAASADARDRSLAKTRAADAPPMPDPRRALLKDAMTAIQKAIRLFPSDPEVPELESIYLDLSSLRAAMKENRTHDALNAAD